MKTVGLFFSYHGTAATLRRPSEEADINRKHYDALTFMTASSTDENAHAPAESWSISGRDEIKKLRDFLNEHYPVDPL